MILAIMSMGSWYIIFTKLFEQRKLMKSAEAAAKTAHGNKVAAFQLCKSMDRTAATYYAQAKKEGKTVKPAEKTDACADPGAFVYTPPAPAAP